MNRNDCFELGFILKTHGLKGEIKAVFDSDNPLRYTSMESVFVDMKHSLVPFFIEYIRQGGQNFIIKFEGIDSVEETEEIIGKSLWLPLEFLPELESDEFYFHEVIEFEAWDEKKGKLGLIKDYYSMGPQDLLSVDYNGTELLIPVAKEFIHQVDRKQKKIIFNLPDGLTELYSE